MSVVVGIDLSSHAIDLVRLDETANRAEWVRLPLEGATSFERCRSVAPAMATLGSGFYDDVYLAAIERPKTRFMPSAAALFPVFGAVLVSLPAALPVWDVSPGDWRKGLGLKGNATKEECAGRCIELGAPEEWEYPDPYDAFAVAFFARELNSRGLTSAAALSGAHEEQGRLLDLLGQPTI